jgi:flagellar biosynthetic protein FliR
MDIQLIPVEQFQTFLIVTSRVAGFIGAIPVISSAQAPGRIKTAMVVAISLAVFPVMSEAVPNISFSPLPFMLLIISELLLGLLLGLVARLIFTAVEFGATVIGYQMGFAAAEVFDPQNQRQVALISQFQNIFAILIFLAINGTRIAYVLHRGTVQRSGSCCSSALRTYSRGTRPGISPIECIPALIPHQYRRCLYSHCFDTQYGFGPY